MRKPVAAGIITAMAILAALGVAELGLRFYTAVRTHYDMEMWRYAVELKEPVADKRSHVHRRSTSATFMGVPVEINALGLRERNIPYDKPDNYHRILALGDSLTLGWGVPLEATFAKLIEQKINGHLRAMVPDESSRPIVEVLNMGVGNYNTEQELEALVREGLKYDPDAALLFIYPNDAEPVQRTTPGFLAGRSYAYAFVAQRLVQIQALVDPGLHFIHYYGSLYEGASMARYAGTLRRFAEVAAEHDIELAAVILPEFRQLRDYPFADNYHANVRQALESVGVPVLDTLPLFLNHRSEDLIVSHDDPHPNIVAHAMIADAVFPWLQPQGLVP